MSLPSDPLIQHCMMRLIGRQADFSIEFHEAIRRLEAMFAQQLTRDETRVPFGNSQSHFANRVQWAVAHLKTEGWLEMAPVSGIGWWRFTAKARAHWDHAFPDGNELLEEMMRDE